MSIAARTTNPDAIPRRLMTTCSTVKAESDIPRITRVPLVERVLIPQRRAIVRSGSNTAGRPATIPATMTSRLQHRHAFPAMLALATLAAITPLAAAPVEVVARDSDEFSVTVDGSAPPDARV